MSLGSGLIQKARRNIIDYVELGIVVMSVIIYYLLRILIGTTPAAVLAISIGMTCLYVYIKNQDVQLMVRRWGEKEST